MLQCTATADVVFPDLLRAILAGQRTVSDEELAERPYSLRCELEVQHESEHADHVWDWPDRPAHALWAHWTTGGPVRYASPHWCEGVCVPHDEVCTLYLDHVGEHSWNVHDQARGTAYWTPFDTRPAQPCPRGASA